MEALRDFGNPPPDPTIRPHAILHRALCLHKLRSPQYRRDQYLFGQRMGSILHVRASRTYPIPPMSVQDYFFEACTKHDSNICVVLQGIRSGSPSPAGSSIIITSVEKYRARCSKDHPASKPDCCSFWDPHKGRQLVEHQRHPDATSERIHHAPLSHPSNGESEHTHAVYLTRSITEAGRTWT